jgi:class 3 adenylate cyclase
MTHVSQLMDSLGEARAAAGRQAWKAAYAAFGEVDGTELSAADLESYGEAAWWSGKIEEAIRHRERAFAAYTSAGDTLGAARMALTLGWDYEGRGSFAVAGGWIASAERLLQNLPKAPEHGRLVLTHALGALFAEGELDRAVELFEEAYEVGQQVGDRDVQMLALSGKGRSFIKQGRIDEGLALLDEASASAMCGDISAHSAGLVYCITISSCQDVGDYRRAAEWTEAANRYCDTLDVTGFPGACRIHRAEAMRLRGDWPAAEAQAVAACEELKDFDQMITAAGQYEIGEIRRRRGDFAGAEDAYRVSDELGREPQPGLSLLRLAEGKVDAALAGINRSVAETAEPLFRLRRLPAQVEIAIAAGNLKTARAAADEAEEIVDSYKIGGRRAAAFDATIHFARGQILLAEKDWDGAIAALKRARQEWQGVGAPYETARARAGLGIAYRRSGDEHAATVELDGALATFERLGAGPDEARLKELLGRVETRRTFLFTDIVDSTRLLDTLGDSKWRRLLARHDELVREAIADSGGEVVKQTGDGFFASFESAKAAVDAAVAIQRALADEIVAPDVRIGAHAGGAFRTNSDASDYGGQGVHVAARIGAAAAPGEILVSAETLDGAGGTFRLSEPRLESLKGVEAPVEVVSIDWR